MGLVRDIQLSRRRDRPKTQEALKNGDQSQLQSYADEFSPIDTRSSASTRIKMSTTEGMLYFIALDTLDRLDIQFVPENLTINRNPNIASIQVVGRNNPIYHYISGDTNMNLELDFHSADENREDVLKKCKWLEHLAYNDGYAKEPQRVKLVFGDIFKDELWVIKKVSYVLSQFNKQKGFLPQQAIVSIELGLDPTNNLGWEDVRIDGGIKHLGVTNGRS